MVQQSPGISVIITWKVKYSIHHALLSAMFNLLHSYTNWKLFEKHLCNQSSHFEQCRWFLLYKENYHVFQCATKLTFFMSAKVNGTQRRTLVIPWRMSIICTAVCWKACATLELKQPWTVKKIKPITNGLCSLCSTSQLVENSIWNSV